MHVLTTCECSAMKIGELSHATGVDTDTIRFYERTGVLPPPARQTNGYRVYGTEHIDGLSFVRHCRALDIPLADVRRLLNFTSDRKSTRLNSSHSQISYAVFCLKKKKKNKSATHHQQQNDFNENNTAHHRA